ncbi:hypothetical protein RND81_12G065300 [Saponaria officinalis]
MSGKRNFSAYSHHQDRLEPNTIMGSTKKLRRLPHVFGKVLELPFKSDEDVYVEERSECLKFVASANSGVVGGGIHVVELHPGIVKVVVRKRGSSSQMTIDEVEIDVWRFRLPMNACPELATVVYERGQMVVTVPKNVMVEKGGKGGNCRPGFRGNIGSLLAVR